MGHRKHKPLLEKSVHAALSAIEIYNKPDFKYREETFSILMINAWELILKARLVFESGSYDSIYEFEAIPNKSGSGSKQRVKKNRTNNPLTISLGKCIEKCESLSNNRLDTKCVDNINLLTEIRDTSIHFHNKDKFLCKKIFEIGTATLQNFVIVVNEWFSYDLSKYNFYLMPLSFFHEYESWEGFSVNSKSVQTKNLLNYIKYFEERNVLDVDNPYSVSTSVKTTLVSSKINDPQAIAVSIRRGESDKKVTEIVFTEEQIMNKFPLQYKEMCKILQEKYEDFKVDKKFQEIKRELEKNKKYAHRRLLNPIDSKSGVKTLYSHSIIAEFGNYYVKKQ